MANIQSQIKRNRQNIVRRERNKAVASRVKTHIRQFRSALDEGDKDAAADAYKVAAQSLDKAASKGVLHKNTAAHRKSRMARRLNAL